MTTVGRQINDDSKIWTNKDRWQRTRLRWKKIAAVFSIEKKERETFYKISQQYTIVHKYLGTFVLSKKNIYIYQKIDSKFFLNLKIKFEKLSNAGGITYWIPNASWLFENK